MADKLMSSPIMIHEITPSVDKNSWFKCLNISLYEPTNQKTLKVHKVVKPTIRKRCNKTLETSETANCHLSL